MLISHLTHPAMARHFLNAYHAAQSSCAAPSAAESADAADAADAVNTYSPAVEIRESAQAFVLSAELPGVKREQITIEMDGPHLVLTAERTRPVTAEAPAEADAHVKAPSTDRILSSERRFGKLVRRFKVSEAIDRESLQAKLEDGVLTLVLPKKAESAKRRVVIQ